jgi:hypothetical protein
LIKRKKNQEQEYELRNRKKMEGSGIKNPETKKILKNWKNKLRIEKK